MKMNIQNYYKRNKITILINESNLCVVNVFRIIGNDIGKNLSICPKTFDPFRYHTKHKFGVVFVDHYLRNFVRWNIK